MDNRNNTKLFIAVFLLLCALTGISFWIANSHLMENKVLGWVAMIAVSTAKAGLVLMFFMHLWWEKSWKFVLMLPVSILAAVLVLLLIPDIGLRTNSYSLDRERSAAAPNSYSNDQEQFGETSKVNE